MNLAPLILIIPLLIVLWLTVSNSKFIEIIVVNFNTLYYTLPIIIILSGIIMLFIIMFFQGLPDIIELRKAKYYILSKMYPYSVRIIDTDMKRTKRFIIGFYNATIEGRVLLWGDKYLVKIDKTRHRRIIESYTIAEEVIEEIVKKALKQKNELPSKIELRKSNKNGWTLAHSYARAGYRFDPDTEKDILKTADKNGVTVAHIQAREGYVFDPIKYKDILELTDKNGETVLAVQNEMLIKKLSLN